MNMGRHHSTCNRSKLPEGKDCVHVVHGWTLVPSTVQYPALDWALQVSSSQSVLRGTPGGPKALLLSTVFMTNKLRHYGPFLLSSSHRRTMTLSWGYTTQDSRQSVAAGPRIQLSALKPDLWKCETMGLFSLNIFLENIAIFQRRMLFQLTNNGFYCYF